LHAVPGDLRGATGAHWAASPAIARAISSAGVADDALALLLRPPPSAARTAHAEEIRSVILVADLPDDRATACGIDQPTHRLLWQRLRQIAERDWEKPLIAHPLGLLAAAERAAALELGPDEVRRHVLRMAARALVPAVVARRVFATLQRSGLPWRIVGRGWDRLADAAGHAQDAALTPELLSEAPSSAVVVVSVEDPLCDSLLAALAAARPVALFAPGNASLFASLGERLHAEEHYSPFGGCDGLLRIVDEWRSNSTGAIERGARAARALADRGAFDTQLREQLAKPERAT
jgi:hypothetical protein